MISRLPIGVIGKGPWVFIVFSDMAGKRRGRPCSFMII